MRQQRDFWREPADASAANARAANASCGRLARASALVGLTARALLIAAALGLPAVRPLVSQVAPLLPQVQSAGQSLVVSIITWGPGDLVFERFGHNALRIQDRATGLDIAYNWGMFDFKQPNFLGRFLSGDTKYWVEAFPTQRLVDFYASMDRESIEQVLDLSDAEKAQLADFAANSALEANRYYRYEYFRDNCSTRIRDALNLVLGGALERRFAPIGTAWSYRSESLRLTAATQYSQLGIDLALGPKADLPLSAWEAMFIPMRLRDYLRQVTVPAPGGGTRPLVQEERVLHVVASREPEPTESRGLVLGALGPVLGAWMLMLVPVAPASRRRRRVPAAVMAALFYGITGLLGVVLLGMWVGSAHEFWYHNLTLLLCSPLALYAAVLGPRAILRGSLSRSARIVLAAVVVQSLVALLVSPFVTQQLGGPLLVLLPAHLGLAIAIWRHTQPLPEARS